MIRKLGTIESYCADMTVEIICLQGLLVTIFNLYPFCSHDNMKEMNSLRVTENLLEVLSGQCSQSKKGVYKEEKK